MFNLGSTLPYHQLSTWNLGTDTTFERVFKSSRISHFKSCRHVFLRFIFHSNSNFVGTVRECTYVLSVRSRYTLTQPKIKNVTQNSNLELQTANCEVQSISSNELDLSPAAEIMLGAIVHALGYDRNLSALTKSSEDHEIYASSHFYTVISAA